MRAVTRLLFATGLLLVPASAFSQSFHINGIDAMTQSVKQEGQSFITGLAVRTRLSSDDLPVGLTLMPTLEYWRDTDQLKDFNVRATQKDLTLGLDGRFDFSAGTWRPYAGAGLAAHFVNTKFEAPDIGVQQQEEGHTKIGPEVIAGLQLAPISWLQSFFELKYDYVPPFRQFKLNWGFGVNL